MSTDYSHPQDSTLKTIDAAGVAPKSRLSTAESARSYFSTLLNGDIIAAQGRTRIQANIDGASPFSDAALKEAGQGWMPNVNWGAARGRIRDYLTPYMDFVTSHDVLPNVQVEVGDPIAREQYNQVFSEGYHRMLFSSYPDWSFLYHMQLHQKQLAIYGVGPCFWKDPNDWRFTALKRRNILVPKESPSEVSRLRLVFIRDWMYVDEIYKYIAGGVTAPLWNKEAVKQAIIHAQINGSETINWELMEEKWKNNSFDWAYAESKTVQVVHAFVTEFTEKQGSNGKVSHHIFTQNNNTSETDQAAEGRPDEGDGFLYSKVGAFDSITQALWVCFQDVGNGDFESVRGLGMEAHAFGEAHNRLMNSLLNNAMEAGTTYWKSNSAEKADKLTRLDIGPNRIVPEGIEPMQVNTAGGVNTTLQVAQYFNAQEYSNEKGFNNSFSPEGKQPRTAKEWEFRIGEDGQLTNAQIALYCVQMDILIQETFRKATRKGILTTDGGGKEALEFMAYCIMKGIPEDMFYNLAASATVTITRPVGSGSFSDRIARYKAIGEYADEMPQRKKAQFVRDLFSQIGGNRDLADRYGPDVEQQYPGIEHSFAVVENNGFGMGGTQDPFSPDNAHEVHLDAHIPYAGQLLQGDPQKSMPIIQTLGAHMMAHLEALKGNPAKQAQYQKYNQILAQFAKMAERVNSMAQMQQQVTQGQQQPNPEMMKTQADIQRDNAVAAATQKRKDEAAAQHISITQAKANQDIQLKNQKAQQERVLNAVGNNP